MEIIFSRLHHIDFEMSSVELAEMGESAVRQYVNLIIKETIENTNSRNFITKDDRTQAISIVNGFIEELKEKSIIESKGIDTNTYKIARRLGEKEKEVDDQISRMNNHVKKGSLIQALVKKDEALIYILAKVEYMEFLDRNEADFRVGLPVEKKILKTCLIYYDDSYEIEKIHIYDSTGSIADYWSNGLMELEEASSDTVNTLDSFKAIDKVLGREIKSSYPSDYTLIRNSLISYYNQNENFVFSDMLQKVFKNYQPNDEKLIMDNLCDKIDKLPETKKFERNFSIVPKVIRARKKRVIKITDDIDLILKDSNDDLKGIIKGIRDGNGEYYLKIRVNPGIYNDFNYE